MTTAEQVHPLDPRLSRRDLGIVDDLVAHALEQVRAGRTVTWDEAVAYVRAHPALSVSGDNAPTIAVVAVNRLEETGQVVYDRNNDLRLRRDDDPTFAADPSTIKRAVVDHMSTGHNSSVWKLYSEVFRGQYVHRDVYYACRALLDDGLLAKPNAQGPLLRYVTPVTTTRVEVPAESGAVTLEQQLAADVAQLDAQLEAVGERLDDETDETIETVLRRKARQLEGLLRDRYASHRGIPPADVEYEVPSGGRVDVLDRARRRVVEAKLDAGLTSVCQAVGQAEGYLFALRRFEGVAVDRVAVLLPKRPGLFVLEYLGAIVTAGRPVGLVSTSRQTLYLLSKDEGGSAGPLVAALTDRVLRCGVAAAERRGGRLDPPMVLVLDEAANICRISDLPALYSHLGSRGIIPLTILQSYSQAVGVWGETGTKALWGAATVKLIGAGMDDPNFAEDLSRLVGDHDVLTVSHSSSSGRGGSSRTRATRQQRILPASAIRELPKGRALLLATGSKPALLTLQPWYTGARAAEIQAAEATAMSSLTARVRSIEGQAAGAPGQPGPSRSEVGA